MLHDILCNMTTSPPNWHVETPLDAIIEFRFEGENKDIIKI